MSGFTWRDGERTIRFGRGVIAEAVEVLGGEGYALLTTERAAAMAPAVVEGAAGVHMLGDGLVDELAGDLLGAVARERIVALGGGRVVDTAKALAAASGGTQVAMAVPTTLSGAEMTRIHRRARGADQRAPTVRPRVVVNDPELSASQPLAELAASALNALSHAVEGPCTPLANPVATLAAHDGARLLARSLSDAPDRDGLALGALLAGYVIDSTGYGLHHVLSQTLVRLARRGPRAGQRRAALPHDRRAGVALPGADRRPRRRARARPGRRGGAHVPARGRHAAARPRHQPRRARRVRGRGGRAARARPHAPARRPGGAAGTLRGGMVSDGLKAAEEKMRDAGVPDAAIATFAHYYEQLESGESGMLADDDLDQLSDVPSYDDLPDEPDREALDKAVIVKLNGGLGTSMGMEQAKSLLEVKDGQDLPRHHRRAGARAAQGALTRGCRSCS